MNIHFTDRELFERLKMATLARVKIGSHLYGNNNSDSDKDFLYIYATSENELNSFIWTNHQLQYKEEGTDHNFVSLHTFIRNIINGDSTINYEVVHSDELKGTWIGFLHELKDVFNTYTIKRAYNGFARRDCKHFAKAVTAYDKKKRLGHIVRGYMYAEFIDRDFNFSHTNKLFIETINKFENEGTITLDTVKTYATLLEEQRRQLNKKLDDKTLGLAKSIRVIDAKNLDSIMKFFMRQPEFKTKQKILYNFDMGMFIEAFENWVRYE